MGPILPQVAIAASIRRRAPNHPDAVARAADSFPSGLVTFVFTDIEGSTQLFRRIGDRYPALLQRHQ
jgi:class 3 adenylate cyclase